MKTKTNPWHKSKLWLIVEFCLFFGVLPLYIYFDPEFIHPSVLILPGLIAVFIYLHREPRFSWKELRIWPSQSSYILKHLGVVALAGLLMAVAVLLTQPENFLNLPLKNKRLWLLFSVLYLLISATGQEVIYRVFIRYRYRRFFTQPLAFILASAAAFSFVHVVYFSTVSLGLTFVLGLYLALVYERSRSIAFTALLHGLLGNLAFTLGLGHYFWLDIQLYLNP